MSTTTNFKRIALVAVAALGMGLLSSAPSQAAIGSSSIVLTTTAGTAVNNPATTNQQDSATGAIVTVQALIGTAATDSLTVVLAAKSKPSSSVTFPKALIQLVDTSAASSALTQVRLDTTATNAGSQTGTPGPGTLVPSNAVRTSLTSAWGINDSGTGAHISAPSNNKYVYASFKVFLDTATTRAAGAYVYTVVVSPFENSNTATAANVKTIDVTITVGAAATTASSSATSFAVMTSGSTWAGTTAATTSIDSSVSAAATASTTPVAVVRVGLRTSTSTSTAAESVTVSMNIGSSGTTSGVAVGKNVTYAYTEAVRSTGYLELFIYADGTSGTATINISTANVTFAPKTVTFYSTTATKLTVISATTVLGVGTNTATSGAYGTAGVIWVKATDANGNVVQADEDGDSGVFAYSSAKTVVSDSGTACAYNSTLGYHTCSLTGVLAGSATITIANSSTNEPAATVKGDKSVAVTVTQATPAKLKLAFNKATYAPGEKGYILISALDAAGNVLPGATRTNLIAATGISSAASFTGTAPDLTGSTTISPTTAARVAAVDGIASTDAVAMLTFYAPYSGGTMKISATGGSLLPASGQVEVSATATVTDNGAAALAAVTALATTVASLKTLITTLTNLVLKIQKKS